MRNQPSLQQVVFPLYKPLRLQTGHLKDQLPSLGSRDVSRATLPSSSGDGSSKPPPTQLQTEPSQQSLKVAAPRNKVAVPYNWHKNNIDLSLSSAYIHLHSYWIVDHETSSWSKAVVGAYPLPKRTASHRKGQTPLHKWLLATVKLRKFCGDEYYWLSNWA